MEKKQSSVEWLINEIDMQFPHIDIKWKEWMIDQAKAMHKEEIIKSWMAVNNELQRIAAEKYYNETYGDGKEAK